METTVTKQTAFYVLGQAVSQLEDGKTYTVEIKEKKEKRPGKYDLRFLPFAG